MTSRSANTFGRRTLRLVGIAALMGLVVALGLFGWRWRANATVRHVAVSGTQNAPADTVRHLAAVDSGAVMSELDLVVVGDRVERHPWVKEVEVAAHWMSRTLAISVTERTPAALAVDEEGRPDYYIAQSGHAMPLPDSTGHDVPLVRGLHGKFRPVGPVAPPSVRRVLAALPKTETEEIVAEIDVQPDSSVALVTRPVAPHGPVVVRLGDGDVQKKLRTLRAFARRVLSSPPAKTEDTIEEVDLRFAGQVVTRTHTLEE